MKLRIFNDLATIVEKDCGTITSSVVDGFFISVPYLPTVTRSSINVYFYDPSNCTTFQVPCLLSLRAYDKFDLETHFAVFLNSLLRTCIRLGCKPDVFEIDFSTRKKIVTF